MSKRTSPVSRIRPGDALADEDVDGAASRRAQQVRDPVGLDAVSLLRHVLAIAAQPGFDVDDRQPSRERSARARQRGIRVSAHEYGVRALALDHLGDPLLAHPQLVGIGAGANLEVVGGPRQARVEDLLRSHLRVVVLAGIDDHLVHMPRQSQRGERRSLDELRA